MNFHIALSLPLPIESVESAIQAGKRPRHAMLALRQTLNATLHQPGQHSILWGDRLRAQLVSQPEHWALARHLSQTLTSEDLIFCVGEDIGIPIAALCGAQVNGPKIAVFVVNLDRPRGRFALKSFNARATVNQWLGFSTTQLQFLQEYLDLNPSQLFLLGDQTDIQFFQPGPASPCKSRPLIASGGMEQRDYSTLAAATCDLDVDVKICAFSRNAALHAKTFPKILPSNMSYAYYDWPELRQLYRDADLIAISVYDNTYSAGFTTLLESLACRRPVVVTQSAGPIQELVNAGCVLGVPAQNPTALQTAIRYLLDNPQAAAVQAQRGYEFILERYSSERYVQKLQGVLKEMGQAESQNTAVAIRTSRMSEI